MSQPAEVVSAGQLPRLLAALTVRAGLAGYFDFAGFFFLASAA